jgi:hypothetical protein
MPKLLLNLRGVPDDESAEIRALLDEQRIAYYETEPSRWGVSAGGIWIRHQEDVAKAERLMVEYQIRRRAAARAEHDAARRAGTAQTLWASLRREPLRALALVLGVAFLVALLALPFLMLGR